MTHKSRTFTHRKRQISHFGSCPHSEGLHGKFLHQTKMAIFPFILLVVTVKQVCLFFFFFLHVGLREAISVRLCLPPLVIALDVFFSSRSAPNGGEPCL